MAILNALIQVFVVYNTKGGCDPVCLNDLLEAATIFADTLRRKMTELMFPSLDTEIHHYHSNSLTESLLLTNLCNAIIISKT